MNRKKEGFASANAKLNTRVNAERNKVITYGQVMSALNTISKEAGFDEASFEKGLKNRDGKPVCGFIFSTHELGQKLAELLQTLGFSFERHYRVATPTGKGEIHIKPSQTDQAIKLFEFWNSWVTIEPMRSQDPAIQKMWRENVSLKR